MTISDKSWKKYIDDLRKISDKAAELMARYLETHDYNSKEGRQEAIEYGYALAVKYGEGAAEKACQMYDAVSSTAKKRIPAAEPAEASTIAEVGKAINGTLKFSQRPDVVGQSIGRLVKRTGVDTTMKNALRDGAEWAWIPNGDTCPFCLVLASRGWQRASKEAIKNGHAEHIHANCDCTYAIRFDSKSNVEGYNPDTLREIYDSAEGYGSKDKINYMRRVKYAENKKGTNTKESGPFEKRMGEKSNSFSNSKDWIDVREEYAKTAEPGKGEVITEGERKIKNNEKVNAELIRDTFGGDIVLLDDSDNTKKNPDYLWRGKLWEEQEMKNDSKNSIQQNIREGIKQIRDAENPGGIVLDASVSTLSVEEINGEIVYRLRRSSPINCDVILIQNKEIKSIRRYIKK